MLFSQFFAPTSRDVPSEAVVISHQLMIRAGMISKTASGIYCWLPLAMRVMEKIIAIVADEQSKIGSQRVLFSTIQPAELWKESGRYDSYGKEMLRIRDRKDGEFLYSPTNEEQATDIFRKYVHSYKYLPLMLYQIHWKFRDEIRPRFGVMRGREFLMKDGYSFARNFAEAQEIYQRVFHSYINTFRRMGLIAIPVQADPGAIGGNMSHEFQILAETGESTLFYDGRLLNASAEEQLSIYAVTDDRYDSQTAPIPKEELMVSKGIEVGHIFYFGTKYSKPLDAYVLDENGNKLYPEMGSYGIGISRLIAAIIESSHDNRGIIWPEAVAPFDITILNLHQQDEECRDIALKLYQAISSKREVLYDDRSISVGEKLADADLIGIPYQIIVGQKKIREGKVELKNRKTSNVELLSPEEIIKRFTSNGE